MTGRECRGDVRGLAGLPSVAAEVLEGYFRGWGIPLRSVRSKAWPRLPSLQSQSLKSTQIPFSCEKWQGCSLLEMDNWRCKEPFKGPTHKFFICSHLPWALAKQGQSGLETLGRQGTVALRRELRKQPPGSRCWVIPHNAGSIFLRQSTHLQVSWAWRKAIALPSGGPLPHHVVLKSDCRFQSDQINNWKSQPHTVKSLVVSNRLPKARLGHHLTSPEADPERKNSGKY